jgi:hypothetical protein
VRVELQRGPCIEHVAFVPRYQAKTVNPCLRCAACPPAPLATPWNRLCPRHEKPASLLCDQSFLEFQAENRRSPLNAVRIDRQLSQAVPG